MNELDKIRQLLDSILEIASKPAIIIEESGEIIFINSNAKKLFEFNESKKFFQDYLADDNWLELTNLLKSAAGMLSEENPDEFSFQLKNGNKLSVYMSMGKIYLGDKFIFLITISPVELNSSAYDLSEFSILPANLENISIDDKIREVINDFTNQYPLTFFEKEIIEKRVDEFDELFWIKSEQGNFIITNKLFCESVGLLKIQIEGKNYKEFIPSYLVKFFESVEEFQQEIKSPVSIGNFSGTIFPLAKGKEIIEIPLLGSDRKIIALVGFSRQNISTLPVDDKTKVESIITELISLIPVPVSIIDKSGKFRLSNEEFCKLFKQDFEVIQNSKFENVFPERLSDAVSDFIKSALDGIIIELNADLEIISKPGSGFELNVSRYFSKEIQEELIILSFNKTSYSAVLNNILPSKEDMSDILIKNNPGPIFIYDKENLRFLGVNNAALRLYGYSEEEFLQMDLTDLYTPEDIQTLLESSEDLVKEGEFSKPFKHRKKDGSYAFVRISRINYKYEDVDAYLSIVENVTEQLDLEKYNQLFKSAFENTNDMIFVTDPECIITFVNDSTSRVLGVPRLELINSSVISYCDDEDRVFLNSSVFHSHIKETVTFTIKLKSSDGKIIETDTTSTPIFNSDKEVDSFSLISRITNQAGSAPVQTKEVVREVVKEVIKEVVVEKPVAKELKSSGHDASFLSGVFHEILTPMNVILGFAQELTESIEKLSPEQKEAVEIINQNRSSLLGLMNSIMEFSDVQSKIKETEISTVSITDIVEPLDKNIKELTGIKDAELAYGKISSSLKFSTDKKKFENLLNNLIRLVGRITTQKKIYFAAYPVEDDSFNISVSDGFARSTSTLLETLKKLFIEHREPKEVGVSKLNFEITDLLLRSLNGQFTLVNEFTDKQDFVFRFPLNHSKKIDLPPIVESKKTVIAPEKTEIKKPAVTHEKIETKKPESFKPKDEIEIEEEELKIDITEKQEAAFVPEELGIPEQLQIQKEEPPVAEEEITIEEVPPPVTKKNGLTSLRCLYIEDQVDSQILFKVQMKELKNIQFAASFEEAIPLLESQSFDFIVMDINLQGEYNGLDALKIIHKMSGLEKVPVIAVTAYVLPGDKEKFISTGFTDFISKPIFREKMLESLKKIFVN